LGVAGYGVLRVLDTPERADVLEWFVGLNLGHDLVLLPLYSLAGVALGVLTRGRAVLALHLKAAAALSGLLLLTWFPLVLELPGERFRRASGRGPEAYLERWLLVSAVLFAVALVLYLLRRGTREAGPVTGGGTPRPQREAGSSGAGQGAPRR
jgi:hypothetical protein